MFIVTRMIKGMSITTDTWERLAHEVKDRRRRLDLTQEEAAARGGDGVNRTYWQQIEGARRSAMSAKTEFAICRALGWTEDSIQRIHRGLTPLLMEERQQSELPSTVEIIEIDPALDVDAREILLNLYRSLTRQVAQRRQPV